MKRIIYTLLYENGQFIQSRNFRRQRVGDINWLLNNYDFPQVSLSLDELMIINISSSDFDRNLFFDVVSVIAKKCFIPLTVGGKINSLDDAKCCFENGADKVFMNTMLMENKAELIKIQNQFGSQAIVGGVNYSVEQGKCIFANSAGEHDASIDLNLHCQNLIKLELGEVIFQGIHRDGTGFGIDHNILDILPPDFSMPVILMGGIGNASHIIESLKDSRVDAVATANLLNFIGNAFLRTREAALIENINIPTFNMDVVL